MKNELIKFDSGDFLLEFQPSEVKFPGYDDLEKKIDEIADRFSNIVVTPESYSSLKKSRAEINRLAKELDQGRKAVAGKANKSTSDFENQVMELAKKLKATAKALSDGIKELDTKAIKERHALNVKRLSKIAEGYGVDFGKIAYNPSWDNKTARWTSIEIEARRLIEIAAKEKQQQEQNIHIVEENAKSLGLLPDFYILDLEKYGLEATLKRMNVEHGFLSENALEAENEAPKLERKGNNLINPKTGEIFAGLNLKLDTFLTQEQAQKLGKFLKCENIEFKRV
ncbi:hypothetical protein J2Z60_001812 [Lactobacillus colini]|uniref:Phage protein n=1 Tax=Lactobacillus colini TaxID=1819254 RepID=A0ABS4MH21_9LACO|nr:DUF1351 domain-containing protein [Lactobacillus colini]MBP2058624.1 hypothetical protein [Lactobacillus colini]